LYVNETKVRESTCGFSNLAGLLYAGTVSLRTHSWCRSKHRMFVLIFSPWSLTWLIFSPVLSAGFHHPGAQQAILRGLLAARMIPGVLKIFQSKGR